MKTIALIPKPIETTVEIVTSLALPSRAVSMVGVNAPVNFYFATINVSTPIVMPHIAEHATNPAATIRNVSRVLVPVQIASKNAIKNASIPPMTPIIVGAVCTHARVAKYATTELVT